MPTPISAEYEPLLELGSGGMGAVYLARTTGIAGFERLVALKRMHPELLERQDLMRRFVDEARLSAYVRHVNVVAVHQLGQDQEGYFLVLDYVEGSSLDSLVQSSVEYGGRIPPPIVLRIIADALAGLHAVHEATDPVGAPLAILHRDVSTQNILVGRDGVSRLTDFGVARSALAAQRTEAHRLLGKLLYLPPEYLRQETIDRRLDVYSMGVTLWVALAGVEPWPDTKESDLVHKILHEGLPPLASTGLKVAEGIELLIQHACARRPEDRFPTAAAMSVELERLARETGWMASHAEVAAFVEQLEGERLSTLRASIASCISSNESRPRRVVLQHKTNDALPETQVAIDATPRSLGPKRTKLGLGEVKQAAKPALIERPAAYGPGKTKLGVGSVKHLPELDSMIEAVAPSSPLLPPVPSPESPESSQARPRADQTEARERWKVIATVAFIVIALLVGILIGLLSR